MTEKPARQIVAIDIGYGNVKRAHGVCGGTPRVVTWPACAIPVTDAGLDLIGAARRPDVKLDGTDWYVGVDPEDATDSESTLHRNYVGSRQWRAHLLHGLLNDCPDYSMDRAGHLRLDTLLLGLPVDEWQSADARDRVAESARETAESAGLDVWRIEVLPQPLGAYVTANLATDGALTRRNSIVIDVGYHTLDWSLFRRGKLSRIGTGTTRAGGVSAICDLMRQKIIELDGARVSEARIRAAVADAGRLLVNGEEVDRSDLLRDARRAIVARGISEIQRSLREASDDPVDDVILAGGGAVHYREAVIQAFPRTRHHDLESPETANAVGFWHYAGRE